MSTLLFYIRSLFLVQVVRKNLPRRPGDVLFEADYAAQAPASLPQRAYVDARRGVARSSCPSSPFQNSCLGQDSDSSVKPNVPIEAVDQSTRSFISGESAAVETTASLAAFQHQPCPASKAGKLPLSNSALKTIKLGRVRFIQPLFKVTCRWCLFPDSSDF